jgi:hypothetical protein
VLVEARPEPEPAATGLAASSSPSARAAATAEATAADLATLREVATLLTETGGARERSRV